MNKKHLPLYGIGPAIVFGQFFIAGGAIVMAYKFKWDCYEYEMLNIPLKIMGILSVIFGLYLNYSATIFFRDFYLIELFSWAKK